MSDDIKQRLRCGVPFEESWHELASRTNRERWEAADYIEALERRIAELEGGAQIEQKQPETSKDAGSRVVLKSIEKGQTK
jgi:hypothetical protein